MDSYFRFKKQQDHTFPPFMFQINKESFKSLKYIYCSLSKQFKMKIGHKIFKCIYLETSFGWLDF